VFLSYSRRDAAFVGRLADDLATRGIEPWLDTEDLPTDDEDRWRRSVVQGIRESAAILLILSPDSVRSASVERELTIAAEMTRRIIPIMHRTSALSDGVMFELAGLQRTDFVDQPYDIALDQLVQRIHAVPAEVESVRNAEGDHDADSDVESHVHGKWPMVAAVVGLVLALAGIGLVRDDGAGDDDARIATPTATERAGVSTEPTSGVVPAGSAPGAAERSTLIPWDVATATLERQDGTSASVKASSVALACDTGNLHFKNGQTISLELVESIRFDAINIDNRSADGVVKLLDGRELTDPIDTWNCPIHGTTELGPIDIQLEDIQRIDFSR
jgi:hypothetical protein